ncbi:MAG: type II secretion system minor pseudopilin GspH [Steroidobacterales bacterium]
MAEIAGPTRRRHACGFTLIEILVVVVIIGILAAGTVLAVSLTGRDRELDKESTRLFELFKYAREQAELQSREYGIMFKDDGYEFLAYDIRKAAWGSILEDDVLGPRKLPDGLDFKLTVDGRPAVLTRPAGAKDKTPQIMIFSNGDLDGFAVTLERDGGVRSYTMTQDDKGAVILQPLVEQSRQ